MLLVNCKIFTNPPKDLQNQRKNLKKLAKPKDTKTKPTLQPPINKLQ